MNLGRVHASRRITRVECIAFMYGNNFCKIGQKYKAGLQDLVAY